MGLYLLDLFFGAVFLRGLFKALRSGGWSLNSSHETRHLGAQRFSCDDL